MEKIIKIKLLAAESIKMNFSFLFIFILSTFFVFGQGRNDNWHFGSNASVSFPLGGAPVATINSAFATEEGSSSISDANGNLLFYSDGGNVYDASNNLMPNGNNIQGYSYQGSSTQSCIIIKKPGSTTLFYIFTVAESGNNPNPFSYSIVDMSLNAGLGDVVMASKNKLIFNGTSEKIAATYHCNGTDIWIATHDINSSNYRAVLLSASGLGAPVLSAVGPIVSNIGGAAGNQGVGSMKFSHDGDKLAMCNQNNNDILDILDFNKTTGSFSNRLNIYNVADAGNLYGLEFSPNNQILYVASNSNILQYDISSGAAATISATRIVVGAPFDNKLGQLQLAPNGKIYCAQTRIQPLGIINSPNILGVGCNWDLTGFDVDPGLLGNEVSFGLPSLLHYIPTQFIYPEGSSTSATYCQGDPSAPTPSLVSPYPTVGLFTTTAGGLSINATTGVIDLAASTPNIYTVTFTATVTAGCVSPFFSTYTITVTTGVALCYTKRAAKWYIGNQVGLNFLCSSPPSIVDSTLAQDPMANNLEDVSSISDLNGNILFYSYDTFVRDKNNDIMPNGTGLESDWSSTQGSIVVPNLTNINKYYLFTIHSGGGGFYYSEIDMSLNGGLGDVVVATKNTLLLNNVGEHLTAVENCSGTGTWVITNGNNLMYAYLVTNAGIAAPVISAVQISSPTVAGQLTASPTGRHLALSGYNNLCQLYTFDNETGKICFKEELGQNGYGNSFSNDGHYLYVNDMFSGLFQYDAYAANVQATETLIDDPSSSTYYVFGTMHLGPDCKLYIFGLNHSLGSVINFPNNPGLSCGYSPNSFPLSNTGKQTKYGGPNYIQSWFKDPAYVEPIIAANYNFNTACLPAATTFTNTSTSISDCPIYSWNFADVGSGASNTSSLTNPTHIFSSPGTYNVSLTITERCQTSTQIIPITVYGLPVVDIIADTTVCENFGVTLNTTAVGNYLWTGPSGNMSGVFTSTLQNPTNPVFLGDGFANEGWYYLTVTNAGGCSATDSIYIHILAVPSPNVTSSIVNCIQTLTATVGTSNGPITSYAWGPSGGSSLGTTIVINLPVGYPGPQVVLTVFDSEGCGSGFILLAPPLVQPNVTAGAPLILSCGTPSGIITASSTTPGATYSWAGAGLTAGGTTSSATVNLAGTYTVTVTNPSNGCNVITTVNVTASTTLPTAIIVADTTVCSHDPVTLNTTSIGTYLWTGPGFGPGFTSTLQNPTNPLHLGQSLQNGGWYYLTVTNAAGCSTTDSVYISILTPPDPFYTSSIINCLETITIGVWSSNGPIVTYLWGPIVLGATSTVTIPFGYPGPSVDCLLTDSEGCGQGIIIPTTILLNPGPTADAGADVTITSGASTLLIGSGGGTYLWNTGETSSSINVSPSLTTDYCVTVTDLNGCTDSSCVRVNLDNECGTVFVPNSFSPKNKDLVNDEFKPITTCISDYTFFIFNKWGEKIFETQNTAESWNGYFKGELCKSDVYVYKIFYVNDTNKLSYQIYGHLTLLQ